MWKSFDSVFTFRSLALNRRANDILQIFPFKHCASIASWNIETFIDWWLLWFVISLWLVGKPGRKPFWCSKLTLSLRWKKNLSLILPFLRELIWTSIKLPRINWAPKKYFGFQSIWNVLTCESRKMSPFLTIYLMIIRETVWRLHPYESIMLSSSELSCVLSGWFEMWKLIRMYLWRLKR